MIKGFSNHTRCTAAGFSAPCPYSLSRLLVQAGYSGAALLIDDTGRANLDGKPAWRIPDIAHAAKFQAVDNESGLRVVKYTPFNREAFQRADTGKENKVTWSDIDDEI